MWALLIKKYATRNRETKKKNKKKIKMICLISLLLIKTEIENKIDSEKNYDAFNKCRILNVALIIWWIIIILWFKFFLLLLLFIEIIWYDLCLKVSVYTDLID